ncbi:MAG: methionyl-tRNA formyltransferase, partial [Acidobacteria bacterium]|nr:methionyl-tRNA formyltransferase [Acidobacteriota bacterium]
KTGVTTMLMDPGKDTGPILLQWETEIGPEETAVSLAERLSAAGTSLMVETLKGLEAGALTPQPQDNARASRAPLLKKEHGLIDWNLTAAQIFNRIRGFLPWPGTYTGFRGKKLQIWWGRPVAASAEGHPSPGELVVRKDQLCVVSGNGTLLELLEVQPEGRRRMSASDFAHGTQPRHGEKLEFSF